MTSEEADENSFTFLWKLENISFCSQKKGECIESPSFVVEEIQKTKWKLNLYPRGVKDGNYISYFLQREADSKGSAKVGIKFELALLAEDGSVLISRVINQYSFPKDGDYGFHRFVSREDVFVSRRATFLPQGTLKARCRIWKVDSEIEQDVRCTAYTRVGIEKISFLWNVMNFSSLESGKKYTYQIKSVENDEPLMMIDLSLAGGLSLEEIFHFDLTLQDETRKFCTLQLFLIDTSGNRVICNQDELWFDCLNNHKQFTFFLTKKSLMAKKSVYLPDDILKLYWEFTFSQGVQFQKNVEVQYGSISSENNAPNFQNIYNENRVLLTHSLNDSLKSLYDRQFLCDVKLKTSTSVFPAHKIILSASSSVFNAMFSNDMREKGSDCVNIEDLSDDTIRQMLLYIYTAHLEDLTWESASHLYAAADKYAILSLKIICASYLKEYLSPSNACELLLLADFHADSDLKSAVQSYILQHDNYVINSDEWKQLMETNGKLAAETLCLRY